MLGLNVGVRFVRGRRLGVWARRAIGALAQQRLIRVLALSSVRAHVVLAVDHLAAFRIDHHVMRHMADIESIHTYEGTETIQTLIVGRDITGVGAFA